jgi:hypothetical protein
VVDDVKFHQFRPTETIEVLILHFFHRSDVTFYCFANIGTKKKKKQV